jgi:hypothetical protein
MIRKPWFFQSGFSLERESFMVNVSLVSTQFGRSPVPGRAGSIPLARVVGFVYTYYRSRCRMAL